MIETREMLNSAANKISRTFCLFTDTVHKFSIIISLQFCSFGQELPFSFRRVSKFATASGFFFFSSFGYLIMKLKHSPKFTYCHVAH